MIGCWTDPLGREVVLHDDTWHGHVVVEHPAMIHNVHLIQDAIERPERICRDAVDHERESYYRPIPDSIPRLLVKVCVEFEPPDQFGQIAGIITTTYPTALVKRGEEHRWP